MERAPEEPLHALAPGTRIGAWRVKAWQGQGAYGAVYRAERVGFRRSQPGALKVSRWLWNARMEREVELLSRLSHPSIPCLLDRGGPRRPAAAEYPYFVMEWVEGPTLYAWAEQHAPTGKQVCRVLAQLARALEAVHAAGAVHRDVKGSNVRVRPADGRAFLTDFGAGHYRGAGTLTSRLLAPGTPAYRSPEAWAFVNAFLRHPTAHYRASACDDLFALGVMAYRLVTDEYPPPTQPGESGAEVWREGGPGARPVRELNPWVSPALEAAIQQLLALAPVERFQGQARQAAEALEQAAEGEGPEGDELLFTWSDEHRPPVAFSGGRTSGRGTGRRREGGTGATRGRGTNPGQGRP